MTALERACAAAGTARPPIGARARICDVCGAVWLDYPAGVLAHRQVHGHEPFIAPCDTEEGL